jgi:Na+/phosphate symporter
MEENQEVKRIKVITEGLSGMCHKAERMLDLTIDGFVHHSKNKIEQAEKLGEDIHGEEKRLTALLVHSSPGGVEDKEQLKALVASVTHLQGVGEALKGMIPHVRNKVNENVLFSDKAVGELKFLFENTREVLKSAGDFFLTRNPLLMNYVLEKGVYLNEIADSYAIEHEDRLISGVCMPKASPLYINILESVARINWHTMRAIDRFCSPKGDMEK